MNRLLVAAVAGLCLLAPASAPALPAAGPFDALVAELAYRRDNDFGGTLDAKAKKKQKAVLKSLVFLAKPSEDLGTDLKILIAVAKAIEKAYPEDFGAMLETGTVDPPSLPELLAEASSSLREAVTGDVDVLQVRIGKLAAGSVDTKARVQFQKVYSDTHTGLAGGVIPNTALLLKGWKGLVKTNKLVDKGSILPAPSMTFTVDGTPYVADDIHWEVDVLLNSFQVTGSYTDPNTGNRYNARAKSGNVTEPGTYDLEVNPLSQGTWVVPPSFLTDFWSTDPTGGTLTIGTLDIPGRSASGSFSFTATGGPSNTTVTVTATFAASWNLTLLGTDSD